jgi:hypothetical protein
MQFKDKINQSVADAVAKIMGEALHPNQQKLDVHEPEKDKLTAKDFEMLRKGKKSVTKEEIEAIDEVKMADLPSTKVQGRAYGSSKPQPSSLDLVKGPKEKDLKSIESEKKKTIKEEDAYDKHMKPSDKPHDKDAAKKRAQDAAVAARKAMTKEEVELQEKLSASADAGDYIKDFKKSDAPQFQGKSPEKRRVMGIAAYLASKKGK